MKATHFLISKIKENLDENSKSFYFLTFRSNFIIICNLNGRICLKILKDDVVITGEDTLGLLIPILIYSLFPHSIQLLAGCDSPPFLGFPHESFPLCSLRSCSQSDVSISRNTGKRGLMEQPLASECLCPLVSGGFRGGRGAMAPGPALLL